ncbi:phosphatase PAP2 family protein [Paenibacillus rhizoplanae]
MLILFFALKHRLELALFLWVGLGSQLLNTLLKLWFHRERPTIHRLIEQAGYSFPSGHSMAAFSLYGVIAYLLWRHMHSRSERLLLILFTVLMTGGSAGAGFIWGCIIRVMWSAAMPRAEPG